MSTPYVDLSHMDSCAKNYGFFLFPCGCCVAGLRLVARVMWAILLFTLSTILSITAMLSQNFKSDFTSCFTSALARGQLSMIYVVSACWGSSFVLSHTLYVDMYSGKSVHDVSMALMLSFMPGTHFHGDSFMTASSLCRASFGPGLYMILMLYWCMHIIEVIAKVMLHPFEYGYHWFVVSDYVDMGETALMEFF